MKHFGFIKELLQRYVDDTDGASAIEYALIAALIGVGMIAGLNAFGNTQNGAWGAMSNAVGDGLKN